MPSHAPEHMELSQCYILTICQLVDSKVLEDMSLR